MEKNRNGQVGNYEGLYWDADTVRFYEEDRRFNNETNKS